MSRCDARVDSQLSDLHGIKQFESKRKLTEHTFKVAYETFGWCAKGPQAQARGPNLSQGPDPGLGPALIFGPGPGPWALQHTAGRIIEQL